MQKIKEWQNVDRAMFEAEIFPANQPAVLRGLVRNWPAVQAAQQSRTRVVDYLKRCDAGGTVSAMVAAPQINGRFFYSDDFQNFNFESLSVSITAALDNLVSLAETPRPPAVALQAIPVTSNMPSFLAANKLPLLDTGAVPRIWIGNRSIIATHFDNNHNIACVAAGRRKFTVFPPDQVANLYIGPLLRTPGGSPVSIVDLRAPDLARFPKFKKALEVGQEAVLEPGDAIYVPLLWWHGVESLEPLNVLVNYWWNNANTTHHKTILSLVHSMVLLSGLPAEQRESWRTFFDYFVFQAKGDPGLHLPDDLGDVYGDLSPEHRDQIIAFIAERLRGEGK